MPRFRGVGPRIAARLLALGYRRPNDKPDVTRFCLEHRYDPRVFYEWLGDRQTPFKELGRLAADLGVSPGWLLFGEPQPRGRRGAKMISALLAILLSGGVPGATGTPWAGQSITSTCPLSEVQPSPRWRRRLAWLCPVAP
jgi:hypothetical protein